MSKRGYNQIIFLTTLSVYLGLVLVGSSPQILAQAALTAKFNIEEQIERQNDSDKNDDEIEISSQKVITESFIEFTKQHFPNNSSKYSQLFSPENSTFNLSAIAQNLQPINIEFSPTSQEIYKQAFLQFTLFSNFKTKSKLPRVEKLHENLEVAVLKNQSLIFICLPRSSIDSRS